MTDPLEGLDAARRAGWARSFDAEKVAADMLTALYLAGALADGWEDFERRARRQIDEWLNAANTAPGWIDGAWEPPPLTPGQVDARIRIARRFLELEREPRRDS